jgi:DNA topoisomerase I
MAHRTASRNGPPIASTTMQMVKRPDFEGFMGELAVETIELEARRSAQAAKLRYVTDTMAGIRRLGSGKGFVYLSSRGRMIRDAETLARIRSLAIPPAWKDVWICPWENGHLQASGFDARGRKQYRYHPAWAEVRNEQKYSKLILFARALPRIRARVRRDLARHGLPREKVLAAVVRLLELTRIRVGNDEYARQNRTFGLTTIKNHHAEVKGSKIRFDFHGKHAIKHEIELENPELAKVVRKCQELSGEELFEYIDDNGQRRDVKSSDVNSYLRSIACHHFSAKDFRTWAGTVAAAYELKGCEPCTSKTSAKRVINQAVARVAERLGNTKAVCRKCYIHPVVIEAYLEATLHDAMCRKNGQQDNRRCRDRLPADEAAVLRLLEMHERRRGRTKVTMRVRTTKPLDAQRG